MVILGDRVGQGAGTGWDVVVGVQPLATAPAKVQAAGLAGRVAIDFLVLVWPTSPMKRSPVARSKLQRQGLRRPNSRSSGGTLGVLTKGLLTGMV